MRITRIESCSLWNSWFVTETELESKDSCSPQALPASAYILSRTIPGALIIVNANIKVSHLAVKRS